MKIIFAGCGAVGTALALQLSNEGHDLVIIDDNQKNIAYIGEHIDAMTILGNCASLAVLRKAGVEDADLLIATTGSDEANFLSCMTAKHLNEKIHTIARIRNPEYTDQAYGMRHELGLSLMFNPELQTAKEIDRLLRFPGFLRREVFANNRAEIVELRIEEDNKLVGVQLKDLNKVLDSHILVCVVQRNGEAFIPSGDTQILVGDCLYITAPTEILSLLLKELDKSSKRAKKVLVVGGGSVGYHLSESLIKARMDVTIIEKDSHRAKALSEALPKANIICGNGADKEILESENIDTFGALVSVTGSDERNILISLFGESKGVPQIVTKLGEFTDINLLENLSLGAVVSPVLLCSNTVLRYVRAMQTNKGAVLSIHAIADGLAEALEFDVQDQQYCGISLRNLNIRKDARIACIFHGNQVELPNGDSCFCKGDTVIAVTVTEDPISSFGDLFD